MMLAMGDGQLATAGKGRANPERTNILTNYPFYTHRLLSWPPRLTAPPASRLSAYPAACHT